MNRFLLLIFALLLSACNSFTYIADDKVDNSPSKLKLDVPFTTQAPNANWDDPYQEACEEASLIMVHSYLSNIDLNIENSDEMILNLIKWEKENSYAQDVTLDQLAMIAEKYYKYETEIINNPNIDDIKKQIEKGNPVIVPVAGRNLGNPYFSGEGPWYHMLVIIGYKGNKFITNDPGTKRGEGYKYNFDVLLDAIHDWTGVKEEIEAGGRKILVVHMRSEISEASSK
ncbi:MAG: C39 family peptidase [Candidatus Peribacteraceae bacterium]|nr:C39 family peptidase [Candidatus Peribacteraceae bacterium]